MAGVLNALFWAGMFAGAVVLSALYASSWRAVAHALGEAYPPADGDLPTTDVRSVGRQGD